VPLRAILVLVQGGSGKRLMGSIFDQEEREVRSEEERGWKARCRERRSSMTVVRIIYACF
jgi:hypothetical protein